MELKILLLIALVGLFLGCTQETQNKISRSIQNWTGTNGTLEVYAGEERVYFEFSDYSTSYIFYEENKLT